VRASVRWPRGLSPRLFRRGSTSQKTVPPRAELISSRRPRSIEDQSKPASAGITGLSCCFSLFWASARGGGAGGAEAETSPFCPPAGEVIRNACLAGSALPGAWVCASPAVVSPGGRVKPAEGLRTWETGGVAATRLGARISTPGSTAVSRGEAVAGTGGLRNAGGEAIPLATRA
jgi:hypothetical protein